MQIAIDWRRLGRSHYREDRELAELGRYLEKAHPGLTERVIQLALSGQHPRVTAREIEYGTVNVPLTRTDASHVQIGDRELREGDFHRFMARQERDRRFDRTLLKGSPLTEEQVERITAAHASKLANWRCESFARFVSVTAMQIHVSTSWWNVVNAGAAKKHEIRRYWVPAPDDAACPRCLRVVQLNPIGVGIDELFLIDDGERLFAPPLCVRCRCCVSVRIEREGVIPAPYPGSERFQFPEE